VPDVQVSYDEIQTVSQQLNSAVQNIIPQLTTLKTQVDGMLTQGGGMWLDSTSPVLQETYANFNTGLNSAVNGISQFAQQFDQIANQVWSMDAQFAKSISSSANTPPAATSNPSVTANTGSEPFPNVPNPAPASGSGS
jgi:uncharacterized protein YukE